MITDAQWENEIPNKIMALSGMRGDSNSDFIAEPFQNGVSTYIKFMSDHGVTDDHNGVVFGQYLRTNGCVVDQLRPRAVVVQDADIVRLFL